MDTLRVAAVVIAAAKVAWAALSGNTKREIPYPRQTAEKITGKKCPPLRPIWMHIFVINIFKKAIPIIAKGAYLA